MVCEGECMEHKREWCVRVGGWNMSVNGVRVVCKYIYVSKVKGL